MIIKNPLDRLVERQFTEINVREAGGLRRGPAAVPHTTKRYDTAAITPEIPVVTFEDLAPQTAERLQGLGELALR